MSERATASMKTDIIREGSSTSRNLKTLLLVKTVPGTSCCTILIALAFVFYWFSSFQNIKVLLASDSLFALI